MPTIEGIIKKAPLAMLQEVAKGPRPKKWTCNRCGSKNKESSLRCEFTEGPAGICGGLGLHSQSSEGPKVWDMVKAELRRRGELKAGKVSRARKHHLPKIFRTPLQEAALKVVNRWEGDDPVTGEGLAQAVQELEKALKAEGVAA